MGAGEGGIWREYSDTRMQKFPAKIVWTAAADRTESQSRANHIPRRSTGIA